MTTNFGKEMSCTTSLRTGRYVTGARLVAEAAFRRLDTEKGLLLGGEEEANYGIKISAGIGSSDAQSYAAALPGRIEAELLNDDRIQTVTTTCTVVVAGPLAKIQVRVSCETTEGPFVLTLAVSAAVAEILGIEADS